MQRASAFSNALIRSVQQPSSPIIRIREEINDNPFLLRLFGRTFGIVIHVQSLIARISSSSRSSAMSSCLNVPLRPCYSNSVALLLGRRVLRKGPNAARKYS